MNTLAILAIAILISTLFVRYIWLSSEVEKYSLNAVYYCHRKKLGIAVAQEMAEIWPIGYIIMEIWRWDFSRYVVHQDHLEGMALFIHEELQRKDLDFARWEKENAPHEESPTEPSQPTPPSDSSKTP